MLEYFFKSMPKIVFEPYFVLTVLWCIYTFFFRKKNKVLFWIVTGCILFMVIWRLAVHSVMLSSRYSLILIYPAMIFSAFFCMKTPAFFRWLFKKCRLNFPHKHAFCYFLAAATFIALAIGSIAKIMRFNPYADIEKRIVKKLQKHKKGPGEIHILSEGYMRFVWYTNKKMSEFVISPKPKHQPLYLHIKRRIEVLKNVQGDHYMIFYHEKGETEPTPENMQLTPEYGSWNIIERFFDSPKKKKELLLAHYKPVCPNIQEWKTSIPEKLPPGNICRNGDFEKFITGAYLENLRKSYLANQVEGYQDLSQRKLPFGWYIALAKWNSKNPPDFRMTEKDPLAGKFSLQIDARPPASWGYCYYNRRIYNKRYRYTIFIRGKGNSASRFVVRTISYNFKTKKSMSTLVHTFRIEPGKTYRLQGTIPTDQFPAGFRNFIFRMEVRNFVVVDQVSLVPY